MDQKHNENLNDKEIQSFFNEIDNIFNEEDNNNFVKLEEELNEKCFQLIKKKENSHNLSIQSKLNLFIEEIEFINNVLDTYEKEKKKNENKNENLLKKDGYNESEDILNDLIYLELGLRDSDNTNETKKLLLKISENLYKIKSKEFILTMKKSLDIRINDFRKNEISEEYFSKKINEIYIDTKNQLDYEIDEKEKKSKENIIENSKNILIDSDTTNNLVDMNLDGNLIPLVPMDKCVNKIDKSEIDTKNENDQIKEAKISNKMINIKKNRKEQKIESSNFFHKKKLKLVERWNRVAEETKLLNDYDSSY
ncbi:conserved Plasmodium protein, unknown function [Plasmodium gallinaceum]|uniref:Uncharacterized protein n=1 Tax=Plasmodium gallinaceum TaxID=5849 RepID=A0A1J1GU37_PLAGA|nr:conserved Plasmodium protein, unknown function [Plasmodium gallinaceum]CRG95755.1 conserved Plasmodium protein, unknown function [Plasmodium gallinaceum]